MTTEHKGHRLVDLDGTLAHYTEWKGAEHIGEPVKPMLEKVRQWLEAGQDVRIFTARVFPVTSFEAVNSFVLAKRDPQTREEEAQVAGLHIREWCVKHLGQVLPITCRKDMSTIEIYDDRAVGVMLNKGIDRETLISWHLLRVLQAAKIPVTTGVSFAAAADVGAEKITTLLAAFDNARADLDGALDALKGVKGAAINDASLLRHAVNSLSKAVKAFEAVK
jgi:hypothetical protein